jgi:hypothetical protein
MATGLKDRRFGDADTHSVREALEIRGLDLKNLPAFMDGKGEINLSNVVRESVLNATTGSVG